MARIFDVIEAPDMGTREIVHRFPELGSGDFRIGSQVIVRESQTAVFYRDGKALDVFSPGRHTISTANIPLLINLVGKVFGDRTPFTAEVYFVNMREFVDMKWGTPEPIPLRDTELGLVRLGMNGLYSMQVSDPQLFVNMVVGTQGLYQLPQIEERLRTMIVSRLTDLVAEVHTSVFDLPKLFEEVSAGGKAKLQDDFAALGLTLKAFAMRGIHLPEAVQKAMDQRGIAEALGGTMPAILDYEKVQAIRDIAARGGGVGGGLTDAGVGLGAAFGLGQMMTQQAQQAAAAKTAATPAAVPDVMTPAQAAAYLQVAESDVMALIQSGQIKAKQIGTQYRISKSALDEFLKG